MAALLKREGIDSEIYEYTPGRGSLVARLSSAGSEPPLCLMSHIDVATAEAEHWPDDKGPLSGLIDEDGVIWGRGALDMKGMGAIEVMTMIWLKRLDLPLKRDIVLLAVADEEIGNSGAKLIAEHHWDEIGCSHMVNEGGFGVPDVFFDDQTVYAISSAEKGVLWVKMIAHGEAGHGSTPYPGRAPERLLDALKKVEKRKTKPEYHPSLYELLYHVGKTQKGLNKAVLTRPTSVRMMLSKRLMSNPATRAMVTNTVHLTGFEGAKEPNVVPSEVAAVFDCRVLPGTRPEEVLEELSELVDHDPNISFEVVARWEGNGSPYDDPFFAALASHAVGGRDDAVAGPIVSVGFTDSIVFRPLGVRAYGLIPFEVPEDELATMHGHGERVAVEDVGEGLKILFKAVVDVGAKAGHTLPGSPLQAPAWESPALEESSKEPTLAP